MIRHREPVKMLMDKQGIVVMKLAVVSIFVDFRQRISNDLQLQIVCDKACGKIDSNHHHKSNNQEWDRIHDDVRYCQTYQLS